ncbi:MAG: type IV pilin N-terminal domain-containing protein [Methanomicrobium sp.]|nr:type IV pilin N-terminal domain-containing protein [Methanomicrobium sp.]
MKKFEFSNEAVSPVVGVMLMLVVTIIIAAVVSGFAGSMTGTVSSPSQISLKGTYSQGSGMTITHAGGDTISLSGLTFSTMPSDVMGTEYEAFYYSINPVVLNYSTSGGSTSIMDNSSGFYYKAAFVPGDVLVISAADCDDYASDDDLIDSSSSNKYYTGGSVNVNAQVNWGNTTTAPEKMAYFRSYQFQNPENIGKYFYLYLTDSAQTTLAKVKVPITA